MYRTILVPVDGGPGTRGAIAHALAIAGPEGATVHALAVVETNGALAGLEADQRARLRRLDERRGRRATATLADLAGDLGFDAVREIREGTAHRVILDYADEVGADLIVMGTRSGTVDAVRLGSTTERVITLGDTPILAVRSESEDEPSVEDVSIDRVLVPTDGSDAAERAADHALALADSYGAAVSVVYVVDTSTYALKDAPRSVVGLLKEGGTNAIEAIATDVQDRGISVTTDLLRGTPEREILDYADGADASLIVMGTRGWGIDSDRLLGSTTARVLRRSDRPILTVN
jgi:nucleotide-binding universal stress UspA family protein